MPKVMLKLVALVFEGVKSLILYLPSRSSSSGEFVDIFQGDNDVGYPGKMSFDFSFLISDYAINKVNFKVVVCVIERHLVVKLKFDRLSLCCDSFVLHFNSFEPLKEAGVPCRIDIDDKMSSDL